MTKNRWKDKKIELRAAASCSGGIGRRPDLRRRGHPLGKVRGKIRTGLSNNHGLDGQGDPNLRVRVAGSVLLGRALSEDGSGVGAADERADGAERRRRC